MESTKNIIKENDSKIDKTKSKKDVSFTEKNDKKSVKNLTNDTNSSKNDNLKSSKNVKPLNTDISTSKEKDVKTKETKKDVTEATSKASKKDVSEKNTKAKETKENLYLKEIEALNNENIKLTLTLELKDSEIKSLKETIEDKDKVNRENEKSISILSAANKKLLKALDELKKEIDDKVDRINLKQINKLRSSQNKASGNPLEVVLKIREKEIRNSSSMIGGLRKEREELEKKLTDATDYKYIMQLHDKIKIEEKKNFELQNEIKTLSKRNEDCQKIYDGKAAFDNELKLLVTELSKSKELIKDLKKKSLNDEMILNETKDKMLFFKRENDEMKKFINSRLNPNLSLKSSLYDKREKNNNDDEKNNSMVHNFSQEEKMNNNINNEDRSSINNNNDSTKFFLNVNNNSNKKPNNKNNFKSIKLARSPPSKLKNNRHINIKESELDSLFTKEELVQLEKIISNEDLERYQKKYNALLKSKQSLENKAKAESKKFTLTITENEEKLEYLSLQLKESEQKAKILSYQINEYRSEIKNFIKNKHEISVLNENLRIDLMEKEQENKILVSQLQQLRKLTKHNALAPLDYDITKKIDMIRNEENDYNNNNNSNSNNYNSNISNDSKFNKLSLLDVSKFGYDFDVFAYEEEVGKKYFFRQITVSALKFNNVIDLLKDSFLDNFIEELRVGYSCNPNAYYHNVRFYCYLLLLYILMLYF